MVSYVNADIMEYKTFEKKLKDKKGKLVSEEN